MSDIFQTQLFKAYDQYLKSYILGSPFERITLRGGKKRPGSTADLHESIRYYCSLEKTADRNGWTIEWESWDSKKLGHQKWPASISITTAEDLLFLTDKSTEFSVFSKTLSYLLKEQPALSEWLAASPQLILQYKEDWPGIFAVVDYLMNNDLNRYYLRNVPVQVHTKFIEANKQIIKSLLQFLKPSLLKKLINLLKKYWGSSKSPTSLHSAGSMRKRPGKTCTVLRCSDFRWKNSGNELGNRNKYGWWKTKQHSICYRK